MTREKSSSLFVVLLLTALMSGLVSADSSPLSRFSPEQLKRLKAGEVVFEYAIEEDQEDGIGHGVAYVIINKPARWCYNEMIKFGLKEEYFPRLVECDIIKSEGNKDWVHEVLDFKIAELEYVTLMIKDDEKMRVDYYLDPEYPHDLAGFDGYYYFDAVDEKSALITYVVSGVDVGLPVPEFIMKALSQRDLPGIVENVKKRFESDGKWKKE